MLFTIVEDFGVADGESWSSYIEWRGIQFDRFDSLDGILRPSLFTPETEEDWAHVELLEKYHLCSPSARSNRDW